MSYVRQAIVALVFAAFVIYSISQALLGVAASAAILVAVCLIAWTAHHARQVAEAVHQARLARLARAATLVAMASIVIFGSLIFWMLAFGIAYPEKGFARSTENGLAMVSLLSLLCSNVLHLILMFRLKRFLSRANPVAAYLLLAKTESNR